MRVGVDFSYKKKRVNIFSSGLANEIFLVYGAPEATLKKIEKACRNDSEEVSVVYKGGVLEIPSLSMRLKGMVVYQGYFDKRKKAKLIPKGEEEVHGVIQGLHYYEGGDLKKMKVNHRIGVCLDVVMSLFGLVLVYPLVRMLMGFSDV